ncbi:Img2-domain-containing protein [Plenodomus tracheiphilus IPT5]|uniref:Large ribosomal subunit protein mL49 n=1 Tax=Plenodomus tracheiphilus IPT5 TaxID=1408161 RepID=A0A6A7BA65_9PLEO|nr:Img2-domain-containing protein [Plenodomus tracheiphilus IPT5]
MPRIRSFAPLMRSIVAPRAVTCQQRFRFSTAPRMFADKPSESSLPPNATSEVPSTPKEAQRAADLAAAEAITESDSAQPPEPKPTLPSTHSISPANTSSPFPPDSPSQSSKPPRKPSSPATSTKPSSPTSSISKISLSAINLDLPPPKYHVSRSVNKNLPIYTDKKRGGNLHLTLIRKLSGDIKALRDELREFLQKKADDVTINTVTNQVVVKGHHKLEIEKYLTARGF